MLNPNPVDFNFHPQTTAQLMAYLQSLSVGGPRAVARGLNKMVLIWQRETMRHTPVDEGLLRASWATSLASPATQGDKLLAVLGTNVPYAIYIEFGTRWIAGGRVLDWEPGRPVILDWPAKDKDKLDPSKIKVGADGKRRDEQGKFLKNDADNSAEFMPPMRGSWVLLQDRFSTMLRDEVARELFKARP